ncbi:sulfotransferase family protein [Azospirillum doebereinerae]|uniref:Sulfotransferase family protein n=1 Tax=Azospirillum doebereinerae TaxID=92933 RepID=A0A3S0XDT9_9PROT|nr:hypothetical protein [Azospirillum doebereinerae]RUQ75197.1 hypothetical protein EJ913_04945 [Azospirillum doebereinerae]
MSNLPDNPMVPWPDGTLVGTASGGSRRVLPLVVGMHRSGTSMTAGCLHRLGMDMVDDAVGEHETNRGGHYERMDFLAIHDRLLADLGSRWDSLTPLPAGWWRGPPAMVARREIKARLRHALPDGGRRLWGIKDPRLMRLLPLWLDVCVDLDLEPRILLVTRDPDAVARSLARRNAMDRDDALALWMVHHMEFIRSVGELPWLRIDHRDWLEDPRTQIHRLIGHYGISDGLYDGSIAAVDEFIHAEWTDSRTAPRTAPSPAHSLYERLAALADSGAPAPVACPPDLRVSARDFHAFAQTFKSALTRAERLPEVEADARAMAETLSRRDIEMADLAAELAAARTLPVPQDRRHADARPTPEMAEPGRDGRLALEKLVAGLIAERDRAETVRSALMAELAAARSLATSLRTCLMALETEPPAERQDG